MDMDFVYDPARGAFVPQEQKLLGGSVDPSYRAPSAPSAPGAPGFRQRVGDWGAGAWDGTKRGAGDAWQGANRAVGGVVSATPGFVKGAWGAGPIGKAAVVGAGGLAALGITRGVAYPLLSGTGVINDEQQEDISRSGFGRFVTGEQEYDPMRTQEVLKAEQRRYIDESQEYALEEQARMDQAYRDRAAFDSEMSYANAQKMGRLGLDLGTTAKFRDVYAGQLANSTANYLNNMRVANEGIGQILNPRVQVI